ncbi:PHD zinc finger-containing protein [Reticulomyxa filosa]|uniref:PHD zinc finger-containing protein n=1 Tax=Reticulomyxa filosa TaxID=46433 RepID=X6M6E9_RETFI|nr:PHD zinc finger-containing protein [Reticulomyxa filosa]|eukprot:ETO09037.1 PHD zinc finger-containing protein [Reticulomyxa filosa]
MKLQLIQCKKLTDEIQQNMREMEDYLQHTSFSVDLQSTSEVGVPNEKSEVDTSSVIGSGDTGNVTDSTPASAPIYGAPVFTAKVKGVSFTLPGVKSSKSKAKPRSIIELIEKTPLYVEKHKSRLDALEKYVEMKRHEFEALSNKHEKVTADIVEIYFEAGGRMGELRKKQRALSSYAQQLARQGTVRNESLKQYVEVLRSIENERSTMLAQVENPTWEVTHHFHMLSFEHFRGNKQAHLLEIAEVLPGRLWISAMANDANRRHEELLVRAAQTDKEREILKTKLQVVSTQRHATQEHLKDLKKMMKIIRKKVSSQRIDKEKASREKKESNKQEELALKQQQQHQQYLASLHMDDMKSVEHESASKLPYHNGYSSSFLFSFLFNECIFFIYSFVFTMDRYKTQDLFEAKHLSGNSISPQLHLRVPMHFLKNQPSPEQKVNQRDENIRMKWMVTLGFHPQKTKEFDLKDFLIELNSYLSIPWQQTKEEVEKLDAPPLLSKLQETGALSNYTGVGTTSKASSPAASSVRSMDDVSAGESVVSSKSSKNSTPNSSPSSIEGSQLTSSPSSSSSSLPASADTQKLSTGNSSGEDTKAASGNNSNTNNSKSKGKKKSNLQPGQTIAREVVRPTNPQGQKVQEQLRREQEIDREKEKEKEKDKDKDKDKEKEKEKEKEKTDSKTTSVNVQTKGEVEGNPGTTQTGLALDAKSKTVERAHSTGSITDSSYGTNWAILKKHFDKYERTLYKRSNVQKELEEILNVRETLKVAFQQLQGIYNQYILGNSNVNNSGNVVLSPNEILPEKTQRATSA